MESTSTSNTTTSSHLSSLLDMSSSPAASVTLACCQSLCDLLKELPLPQPHASSARFALANACHTSMSSSLAFEHQLESALTTARQQLTPLVFNDDVNNGFGASTVVMSPLLTSLSSKGLFATNHGLNWISSNNNNENNMCSLETLEPSIGITVSGSQLADLIDDRLIDDLQNDCNDSDVKYYVNNNSSECSEDYSSSLGERVKSRQRQQQQQTTVTTTMTTVTSTNNSNNSNNSEHNNNNNTQTTQRRREATEEDVSSNSCNSSSATTAAAVVNTVVVMSSSSECATTPSVRERSKTNKQSGQQCGGGNRSKNSGGGGGGGHQSSHNKTKTTTIQYNNICHDFQNKDSLVSFECVVNRLMKDSINEDNSDEDSDESDGNDDEKTTKNDMSFDLKIDLKELNLLMNLSSKLKHSNRMRDLEQKLSTKLTSFLSLLTNQMTVWFSKFKECEDINNANNSTTTMMMMTTNDHHHHHHHHSGATNDDNLYWQLLVNSSKMAMNIMTAKGMSSRVVLFEELLEIIINFLSHNLNSKTHVTSGSPSKTKKQQQQHHVMTTTTASKRQVTHWCELLELLLEYLQQNKSLNDSIILMLTRIAMNSLYLNANEMQLISIQLLHQIFKEYPKHRNSILEELLQSFHRIPLKSRSTSSSSSSTVSTTSSSINVLTKLLIQLTNALFACERTVKMSREVITRQLTECLSVISAFLSSFVKKCLSSSSSSQTSSECDLKSIFDHLLNDLLNTLYFPSTLSSLLLIQILTKLLINYLTQNNTKSVSLQIRLNSIEFLSNISSKFAKLLSLNKDLKSETMKTLNQLLSTKDNNNSNSNNSNNNNNNCNKLLEILKLLNQFFNSEKLFAEKMILSSLWIKEKPIMEMESKFFSILNSRRGDDVNNDDDDDDTIDATTASLFVKYLELNEFATLTRLFDASLSHVTSSLSLTTNTTLRSRAMKSLSVILTNCTLEKSTQLLSRSDLQIAMKSALLDSSTSVREATIDLIGRFVLQSKSLQLCDKYCDLIGERILDTGVSVRKRVIKILRDICIEFPEFEKCGEIQLKIIKRVNDEGEGIRRLVLETCRDLWFKSLSDVTSQDIISYKVMSLLHVISVMIQTEGSIDALQHLFEQIVKNEVLASAEIIIDFVVARVLISSSSSSSLSTVDDTTQIQKTTTNNNNNSSVVQQQRKVLHLSAIQLVAVFAHICPQLLCKHCDSLQSLLSLSCDTLVDIHLRTKLIQSLERILTKVSNPSQQLLMRLEEDLTKQILQSNALILSSSVKCLSVLIRFHTNNYKLSSDLFLKFKQILITNLQQSGGGGSDGNHTQQQQQSAAAAARPKVLRSIYSLGLFLKHFSKTLDKESKDLILEKILHLIEENLNTNYSNSNNRELIVKSITSLGFIIESDPKICLKPKVIELYERVLKMDKKCEMFCTQVLNNFRNYLSESIESDEQLNKSIEWSRESLKHMTSDEFDSSSIQSQIIQTYLTQLLDKSLSASVTIRRVACNVIHVIQSGGHVHPLQLVPHLIAMTTDDEQSNRSRADHVLHEIERKFHGFVAMKAKAGIELATQLCARLKCRGFRLDDNTGDVTSRLATLYHVICTTRQSRRGFVQQLLRNFEISSSNLVMDLVNTSTTTTSLDDTSTTTDVHHHHRYHNNNYNNNNNNNDDEEEEEEENADHNSDNSESVLVGGCDRTQLMFEMVLFFPYNVYDEILYILQQLECIQSVNSTHTSQQFTDVFQLSSEEELEERLDEAAAGGNQQQQQGGGGGEENHHHHFMAEMGEKWPQIVLNTTMLRHNLYYSLKCVFLVSFLRKLLKEFYQLKDEKILEYSPNESKIWEKSVHRRQIETSSLSEILLRANPNPKLMSNELRLEELLEEWKRFKSVAMTSNDPQISNQLIQQKVFEKKRTTTTTATSTTTTANDNRHNNNNNNNNNAFTLREASTVQKPPTSSHPMMDDLNESERKRLLESIRKTSCHVSLIDIGLNANIQMKRRQSVMSCNNEQKERKRKRGNKRKRVRIESSDSSDGEEEEEEEEGGNRGNDDEPTTDDDSDDQTFH